MASKNKKTLLQAKPLGLSLNRQSNSSENSQRSYEVSRSRVSGAGVFKSAAAGVATGLGILGGFGTTTVSAGGILGFFGATVTVANPVGIAVGLGVLGLGVYKGVTTANSLKPIERVQTVSKRSSVRPVRIDQAIEVVSDFMTKKTRDSGLVRVTDSTWGCWTMLAGLKGGFGRQGFTNAYWSATRCFNAVDQLNTVLLREQELYDRRVALRTQKVFDLRCMVCSHKRIEGTPGHVHHGISRNGNLWTRIYRWSSPEAEVSRIGGRLRYLKYMRILASRKAIAKQRNSIIPPVVSVGSRLAVIAGLTAAAGKKRTAQRFHKLLCKLSGRFSELQSKTFSFYVLRVARLAQRIFNGLVTGIGLLFTHQCEEADESSEEDDLPSRKHVVTFSRRFFGLLRAFFEMLGLERVLVL